MLTSILIALVIVILILSIIKIWLDLKRKKPKDFVVKEGLLLFLLVLVLLLIDIRFAREGNVKENQEQQEQVARPEEEKQLESDPVKRLLAQLQDYVDDLDNTDKPQLKLFFEKRNGVQNQRGLFEGRQHSPRGTGSKVDR